MAVKLVKRLFCCFGVLEELYSHQGGTFKVQVFGEVCEWLCITKTSTIPFTPKNDGLVEWSLE